MKGNIKKEGPNLTQVRGPGGPSISESRKGQAHLNLLGCFQQAPLKAWGASPASLPSELSLTLLWNTRWLNNEVPQQLGGCSNIPFHIGLASVRNCPWRGWGSDSGCCTWSHPALPTGMAQNLTNCFSYCLQHGNIFGKVFDSHSAVKKQCCGNTYDRWTFPRPSTIKICLLQSLRDFAYSQIDSTINVNWVVRTDWISSETYDHWWSHFCNRKLAGI